MCGDVWELQRISVRMQNQPGLGRDYSSGRGEPLGPPEVSDLPPLFPSAVWHSRVYDATIQPHADLQERGILRLSRSSLCLSPSALCPTRLSVTDCLSPAPLPAIWLGSSCVWSPSTWIFYYPVCLGGFSSWGHAFLTSAQVAAMLRSVSTRIFENHCCTFRLLSHFI